MQIIKTLRGEKLQFVINEEFSVNIFYYLNPKQTPQVLHTPAVMSMDLIINIG